MALSGAAVTILLGLLPWGWAVVLPAALASGWVNLRWGLSPDDRAALGRRIGIGVKS